MAAHLAICLSLKESIHKRFIAKLFLKNLQVSVINRCAPQCGLKMTSTAGVLRVQPLVPAGA